MNQPIRLRLQCDGGSRGNPGRAGAGSTICDAASAIHGNPEEIAACWEFIPSATNNVAEYQGLINGLRMAKEVGHRQGLGPKDVTVDVFMDSKLVVEQMNGRWKIKHPDMKPLGAEVKKLQAELGSVSFTWVPREQNKRADELANRAMDDSESGQWFADADDAGLGAKADAEEDAQSSNEPAAEAVQESAPASGMKVTRIVFVACGTTGKDATAEGLTPRAKRSAEYLASRGGVDAVLPVTKSARKAAEEIVEVMADNGKTIPMKEVSGLALKSSAKIAAAVAEVEEKLPRQNVALVGHPDDLARLIGWVLGSVRQAGARIYLDDGSLSIAEIPAEGADSASNDEEERTPMLRRLNDVHHLR